MLENKTTVFEKVQYKKVVEVRCTRCNKKGTRTISDFQTVNPFNKDKKGKLKTRDAILAEIQAVVDKRAKLVAKEGRVCAKCA